MKRALFVFILGLPCIAQQYSISTYVGGAPPIATPVSAASVYIGAPISVVAGGAGNVFFASPQLNAVYQVDSTGTLTLVAGTSKPGYSGDGGPATAAKLNIGFANESALSSGLASDKSGNLYLADTSNHCVRRVSPNGAITTIAGTGRAGFSGDGGPAANAQLAYPWGVAVDPAGNIYIMDALNFRVRKVSTSGIITTLAALVGWAVAVDSQSNLYVSNPGYGFDKGTITKIAADGTTSTLPGGGGWGIAVDSHGNVFVADGSTSVRKISADGTITVVAGNGMPGYSGDSGPATTAQLSYPSGVAVASNGNLFIADRINNRVRKVTANGIVTTVAGSGAAGQLFADCSKSGYPSPTGDNGPATGTQLNRPLGVTVDADGNLFIADTGYNRIRKVSRAGIVTTVAGTGQCGFSGDGGPAISAQISSPLAVAADAAGNLFIVDSTNRIRKLSASGVIDTIAGTGTMGFSGDGGPATQAQLRFACDNTACGGIAVDAKGNVVFADGGNNRVRRISSDGIITTVAGKGTFGFSGDGGAATDAELEFPRGVAADGAGNLFIAEGARIRKVSTDGTITTVAGVGATCPQVGFSGDGGPATSARLDFPIGVAVDSSGNLYIADPGLAFDTGDITDPSVDNRIRRVSPQGIITTLAGNGPADFSGDGGPANTAAFNGPVGVAVDAAGNVFVADTLNNAVRQVRLVNSSLLIGGVVDAASQRAGSMSPGKIVVIYGVGLGPSQLAQNQPANGRFGTAVGATTVSFNGIAAPILYASATQVGAVVPYSVTGSTVRVSVTYQGQTSADFTVPLAAAAPNLFTLNEAGWGQAAATNAADGTANASAKPVKIGAYISLYATGEGQTSPAGIDGKVEGSTPAQPVLPVSVTVDGIRATIQYAGSVSGQVAGVMQVNVQIPNGVRPGGYVPVVLQVGDASTAPAEVWIAVSGN